MVLLERKMTFIHIGVTIVFVLAVLSVSNGCMPVKMPTGTTPSDRVELILPEPRFCSGISIEQALLERRSIRSYADRPLTLSDISQLLWAAQGITDPATGFRTAPSAGATYPLETYLVAGNVKNVAPGVYRYEPGEHKLVKVLEGDVMAELASAAVGQSWVREAGANIVFTAVYERTTQRYGDRGERYVHMEAGHASQNVYLQATALQLGTVTIGAFYDEQVQEILLLPDNEKPLYIMPVGKIIE